MGSNIAKSPPKNSPFLPKLTIRISSYKQANTRMSTIEKKHSTKRQLEVKKKMITFRLEGLASSAPRTKIAMSLNMLTLPKK